jgi:transposase InsO family protein
MELRDHIQRIAVEHRHYGYRRVTAELRRQGRAVNHKRVARLMRLDNLLALRRASFRPPTTDSTHGLRVYVNLAARLTLTGPDQLWIADLTYIQLRGEFVYLAVVLDRWSRKVIGWQLSRSLQSAVAVDALEQALQSRQPPSGLVHHSDRGIQYASEQYTALLGIHGILPSMSRPGNPYDNAFCESFIKTLKREQISAHKYHYIDELNAHLEEFIEHYYNRLRLHSALGYKSPEQFEAASAPQSGSPVPGVSFSRHGEIYRSWKKRRGRPKAKGEPVQPGSPAHRIDESPVGYSLTGWSPPEPVSASPTDNHSAAEPTK